jgi:hypothetical protein
LGEKSPNLVTLFTAIYSSRRKIRLEQYARKVHHEIASVTDVYEMGVISIFYLRRNAVLSIYDNSAVF